MDLRAVLDAVQARAPYLRCTTGAVAGADGWLSCADLIADTDALHEQIAASAEGRGTDDMQVLASLWVQSYTFRVPSIAVAAWALGLPVPTVAAEHTLVHVSRNRPAEVAVTVDTIDQVDAATLVARVVDEHLAPFVAAVRAGVKVGERLLWGNVATSLAAIFRSVHGLGPHGDPAVRQRAGELFGAAPDLAALGAFATIEVPGALGWWWDRSNCCLWYQIPGNEMCEDCSLHDHDERVERRHAELVATAEETIA